MIMTLNFLKEVGRNRILLSIGFLLGFIDLAHEF